jgi:hypothetical protein
MSGAGGTAGSGEALGSRGRARPERAAKQGPWKGQPLPSAVQAELAGPGNAPAGEPGVESDESLPADALAEVTLVVSCDVTPDALHRQVFPELLERQQLAQTPQEAPPGPVAGKDAPAPRAQLQYHAEAPGPGVLAYDVEATPGQIQAILSDLEQRPKEFQSLTFALAPAASQSTPGRARAMGEQTQAGRVNQSVQQNVQTDQATSPGGPESLAIGAAQPQDEGLGGARQQQLSRGEVDRLLGDAVRRQAGVQTGPDVNAFQESTAQTVNSAAPGVQSQRMEGGLPSAAKPAGIGAQQQAAPEQPRPAPAAQFAFPGGNAAQPGSGAFGAGMQAAPTQQLALQELQQSDAAKCRVVFVMRVVKPEGGNVAASRIAKEAPAAAMEAAEREATEAPAPAAPAPKPEP